MRFMLFASNGTMIDDHLDVTSAVHRESIDNGWEDTLQLDVAGTVEKGRYIAYRDVHGNWREFRVTAPDELREDRIPDCNVQAVNSVSELAVTRPIVHFHETKVTLRRMVEEALLDTRWQVGDLATDTTPLDELTVDNTDGWALLQQAASTFGLELVTSVEMASNDQVWIRKVHLVRQRGMVTGKRFEYGADLRRVRRTCTDREVALRIIPVGKTVKHDDGSESTVMIGEVNNGRDWLEADDVQTLLPRWGVPDRTGTLTVPTRVVSYPDAGDAGSLYNAALPDMRTWATPQTQYEATVDAFRLAGLDDPGALDVGDTVQIVDRTFNPALRLEGRVSGVEEDLLGDATQKTITLGSIIESVAERQTIITRTAQTVAQGKPVWDAASGVASSANSSAAGAVSAVTKLTGTVTTVQSTADTAATTATQAKAAAAANASAIGLIGVIRDISFTVADFANALAVVRKVEGLPSSMVAGPPPVRAQLDLWGACGPLVEDHDADETIPAGSIRVTCKSKPAKDLLVRLASLKGGAA